MRSRLLRLGAVAAVVAATAGAFGSCRSTPGEPVARLAGEPAVVRLPHRGAARLELTWQPVAPLGEVLGELRVFVHLLGAEREVVRTFDHPFPAGWEVARTVADPLEIQQSYLGPPLAPGTYALTAGLYDDAGNRWALLTGGEEVGRQEYRLATVEVPAGVAAGSPELSFDGDWLPLEPGVDRQILGRRWFTGPAAVAIGEAGAAGEVVFSLSLPKPPPDSSLRLAAGATEPAVRVSSTCDGGEHTFTGTGTRDFAVAMTPDSAGCEVRLRPSFQLVWPDRPPRSAFLQNVYWRSAASPPS
jgi:hypothetical protein